MKTAGQEKRTQLTAYFEYNMRRRQNGEMPLGLTYATAYRHLRYVTTNRTWQEYLKKPATKEKLCRLRTVSPKEIQLLVIILLFLFFIIVI